MTIRYDNRVAVVTGAGAGLGRNHALFLASRGAKIVVNDLGGAVDGSGGSTTAAQKVVEEIKAAGGEAVANADSVATPEGAKAIIQTAIDNYGQIDILINNAGNLRDKSFSKLEPQDFDAVVDVHLSGAGYCTLAAWNHMKDANYGRIVMTTSAAGLFGNFGQGNYAAAKLGVVGLMNVQFAVQDGKVYLLEVNPRASRTSPFVSKATGRPLAKIAARCMAGQTLKAQGIVREIVPAYYSVKESVFPFNKFPAVDPLLGPEMRSTGEVMGWDDNFGTAFLKSQIAAGVSLPRGGKVFVSVKDADKAPIVAPVKTLVEMGFSIVATRGTAAFLETQGVPVTPVNKVIEGQPHIVDAMINGEIQLVFNTTQGVQSLNDSKSIRRTALVRSIPYFTTLAASVASVQAIDSLRTRELEVQALQSA